MYLEKPRNCFQANLPSGGTEYGLVHDSSLDLGTRAVIETALRVASGGQTTCFESGYASWGPSCLSCNVDILMQPVRILRCCLL